MSIELKITKTVKWQWLSKTGSIEDSKSCAPWILKLDLSSRVWRFCWTKENKYLCIYRQHEFIGNTFLKNCHHFIHNLHVNICILFFKPVSETHWSCRYTMKGYSFSVSVANKLSTLCLIVPEYFSVYFIQSSRHLIIIQPAKSWNWHWYIGVI